MPIYSAGRNVPHKHVLDELQTNPPVKVEDLAGAYAVAAIPARYALERSRWAEAAALTRQPLPQGLTQFPQAEAVTVFAQALGAARSGDLEHARQALDRLEALHHCLGHYKARGVGSAGRDPATRRSGLDRSCGTQA